MKKGIFIILFVIELFVALIMMGWMFADIGAVIYLIVLAVFAAVLSPLFKKLKKETDEDKKRKIRRKIVLILFVPSAIALVLVAVLLVNLITYYS